MLENGTIVVFKRGYKWFKAKVGGKRDSFNTKIRLKKLSDIKEEKNFITLNKYLLINNLTEKEEDILKKYNVERLYIKNKGKDSVAVAPTGNSARKHENYWWSTKNDVCLSCSRSCKQSGYVIVSYCPQYVSNKGENG